MILKPSAKNMPMRITIKDSDKTRSLALVLEGGGARCAYQYGVLKAFESEFGDAAQGLETVAGGRLKAAAGSSFGAVNSALFAAGGLARLEGFWEGLSAERIFGDERLHSVMENAHLRGAGRDALKLIVSTIRGVPASRARLSRLYYDFVLKSLDEDAIRKSGISLGMTAVELPDIQVNKLTCISDGFSADESTENPEDISKDSDFYTDDVFTLPRFDGTLKSLIPERLLSMRLRLLELWSEDIPKGKLPAFIAASAAFPAFLPMEVDGRRYTDGGVLDNIPIKMAEKRGYGKVLCIRTGTNEFKKRWSGDAVFITPSRPLGDPTLFGRTNINEITALGEYDGSVFIESVRRSAHEQHS